MSQERPFTVESARTALERACRDLRIAAEGATLVRFGENAIFRLRGRPVIARVGRSLEAAWKEVHVAEWLDFHKFPAARLARDLDKLTVADDLPITFWEFISEDPSPISPAEFGKVLHDLHALPTPSDFQLPKFEPMPKVVGRLEKIPSRYISGDDREFLLRRHEQLIGEFESLDFVLPLGPVHGDAHPGNVMRSTDGSLKLIDFEDFVHGPREWDSAVMSVRHQAFGWLTDEEYRSYVETYGFDPIPWSGFPVIRAMRELNMTTWLAQTMMESREVEAEVHKRIGDLRDEQVPRNWRVF